MSTPTAVWLDCDPGHDDAFAILLAGHHKSLNLIGISTGGGNHTLESTTKNAFNILNISGLAHIPVVAGLDHPLFGSVQVCEEIHGSSGMDTKADFAWPEHELRVASDQGIHYMANAISSHPTPVTIVATGRMTNVALLLRMYPETSLNIDQISIMGGCLGIGNIGPVAEFNILGDPEAVINYHYYLFTLNAFCNVEDVIYTHHRHYSLI
jgi:inosine-uridine nucleoside N-ribohydrolase